MANVTCAKPLQGESLRVTRLDECGNPDFGTCGFGVSDGFVSVTLTPESEEGTRFLAYRANGTAIVNQRSKPILNWYTVSAVFQEVDPEIFSILTGLDVYGDYTTPTPRAAGLIVTEDKFATANFALELWMGNAEEECLEGETASTFGYTLLPWVVEGALAEDITIQNDLITFTITGRTRRGTPWGTGPYDVMLDAADLPAPLPTAIPADTHNLTIWTQLPPPDPECGCQDLES